MNNKQNKEQQDRLHKLIREAEEREYNDDHLNSEERREIVELYKELHPDDELRGELDEDFVRIVF